MTDDILYTRVLPQGVAVRVRRVSESGVLPVLAVLEVDRRAGTPRADEEGGISPPLMTSEGRSDTDVLAALAPHALDDSLVARLMREQGLR